MPSPIKVRRLQAQEWELYRTIRLAALADAPYAFGSTLEGEQAFLETRWQERTRNGAEGGTNVCALAFADAVPVGIAGGIPHSTRTDFAHLVSMWVHADHRGSDAATDLVDFVVSWARDRGAKKLLAGVTTGNDRALRFYEKIGFRLFEDETDPEMTGCETYLALDLQETP